MKYTLETSKAFGKNSALGAGVKRFVPLMKPETGLVGVALGAILLACLLMARAGISEHISSRSAPLYRLGRWRWPALALAYAFLGALAFLIYRQLKSPEEVPASGPATGPLGPSRRIVFTLACRTGWIGRSPA